MSCYSDGDLISYRVRKARAKGGYTVFTGTVIRYEAGPNWVRVTNHALGVEDCVPVETITMHQPCLDVA